jgi:hypothetical protein
MLAEVSQRAAMRSLADALTQERRSAELAGRSHELMRAYGGRRDAADAGALSQTARFSNALGSLAREAERSLADASAQAKWEREALARAQSRAERQAERLQRALAELRGLKEQRAAEDDVHAPARGLARNLQGIGEPNPHGIAPRAQPDPKRKH